MSDVAAPVWARLREGFRKAPAGFKGGKKPLKGKNFPPRGRGKRICRRARHLRQTRSWRICNQWPDRMRRSGVPHVPRLALALRPRPRLGSAGPQHRLARAGVVKHLPLFFDLSGRRVVVVGSGPAADRRAELARSAGAVIDRTTGDPKGAAAVFVATGDLDSDIRAQEAARAAGV